MAAVLARRSVLLSTAFQRGFATSPRAAAGLSEVKYTAKAKVRQGSEQTMRKQRTLTSKAQGVGGRNGKVGLLDASHPLDLKLAMPKALGGSGDGNDPEQLFSLAYASCFLGAMGLSARNLKLKFPEGVSVEARTSIGTPKGGEGFGIAVELVVRGEGSGIKQADLEKIVEAGHQVRSSSCTCSNIADSKASTGLSVLQSDPRQRRRDLQSRSVTSPERSVCKRLRGL